jgi:hypothetical protein
MASEKDTEAAFETHELRQVVVLVRYKPGNLEGLGKADSLMGGIADKVSAVTSAIDTIASYIPGTIKEDPAKPVKSEKEYNYFETYGKNWDKTFSKMETLLQEKMDPENFTLIYDFENQASADDRKQEGQKLFNKLKGELSSWNDYPAAIHFVGLGQGGNIANEAANLFKDEAPFKKDWLVGSLIYIGTPVYKDLHVLDKAVLKGKGKVLSLGNRYDLTQKVIEYFEPADKLRQYIAECNSNLFTYVAGKIILRLVAALSYVLGDHKMGIGEDNNKVVDAFKNAKDELVGAVEDVIGLVKKLISEAPGMIDFSGLPEFGDMFKGYDNIPGKCASRMEKFISDDLKKAVSGFGVDTANLPIQNFFNCLSPIFLTLADSLAVFKFESPASEGLVNKIIENAGITHIHAPAPAAVTPVEVDESYNQMVLDKLQQQKPEEGAQMVNQAFTHLQAIKASKATDDLTPAEKTAVAAAIACITLPMLPTKKALYAFILSKIPLGGATSFLETLTSNAAAAPLKSLMKKVRGNFEFDATESNDPDKVGLQAAINRFDKELKRIIGYLDSKNYSVDEQLNSLYFVYNSHNLMLKELNAQIRETIDTQTGLKTKMEQTGFQFDSLKNDYVQTGSGEEKNVLTTKEVEEEAGVEN